MRVGRFSLRVVAASLALASVPLVHVHADEIIDRVLAVVAGDLIMQSDVRAARELGLVDPGQAADPDRAVLSTLIDRALVLDEVERYAPPEPSPEAIQRAVGRVRERFASEEAFQRALARAGADAQQLRAIVRQNLRIRAYLDQRFASDTPESSEASTAAWIAGLRSRATIIDRYAPK